MFETNIIFTEIKKYKKILYVKNFFSIAKNGIILMWIDVNKFNLTPIFKGFSVVLFVWIKSVWIGIWSLKIYSFCVKIAIEKKKGFR